jgi:uncharacterized protein YjiS (DUF1127 family)
MRKLVKSAIASVKAYYLYKKTYNELTRLSDYELRDIGISRTMIHSIAVATPTA